MARGRMLNRQLAQCVQLAMLKNDTHRLLFVMAIPHLDRDGRMTGNPRVFRATACPMLDHIDDATVTAAFDDLKEQGLVEFYADERGQQVYSSPGFVRQQQGMRYDREAASRFGPPPWARKPPKGGAKGPNNSGPTPEHGGLGPDFSNPPESRNSGPTPEESGHTPGGLRLKGMEIKVKSNPTEIPSRASNRIPRAQDMPPNAISGARASDRDQSNLEGTLITRDWQPEPDVYRWAAEDRSADLPPQVTEFLIGRFIDYWMARPGPGAYRRDWNAQFRTYCRMYRDDHPSAPRASKNDSVDTEKLPPPKHPSLARIEAELQTKQEAPDNSELMATISRVGVAESEGR